MEYLRILILSMIPVTELRGAIPIGIALDLNPIGVYIASVLGSTLVSVPLVLTYMRQYDKQITYGSLLKYTWRYSLGILVAWTLMFIVWYLLIIPMGL